MMVPKPPEEPRRPLRTQTPLSALLTALSLAGVASADPEVDGAEPPRAVSAARGVDAGAFMPFSLPARGDTQRAYALVQGGYDGAARGFLIESAVQANVYGPLSLRAGFGYSTPAEVGRPSVALTLDLLRQGAHGVNLALYAGYQGLGFNTVPAATVALALGRTFGRVNLLASAGYGLGVEQGEHYGEARLGAMVRVHPLLAVGVDTRARLDLERDGYEPEGEPDWDLVAGPLATLSIDRFVVGAGVGVSSTKFRASPEVRTGALAHLSLGAAF